MGLSWRQWPLGRNPNGQFLVPGMPARVLYAEPLRRRLRAELGGRTVVQIDDAVVPFEPGRCPVTYFPPADFAGRAQADRPPHPARRPRRDRLVRGRRWRAPCRPRGLAARHAPEHAAILTDMVALAWRAMDAFYEEDDGIRGHAADPYHRIGIWL